MRLLETHNPRFLASTRVFQLHKPRRPLLALCSAAGPRERVAVPPQPKGRQPEGRQAPPEGSWSSVLSAVGLRGTPAANELAAVTAEQAAKNDVIEELELQQKAALPPPDVRQYLKPVGVMELRYVRMLSSLCSMTYFMPKLTAASLYRRHRLTLVTTSLACEASLRVVRRSAQEIFSESDAMAANPVLVQSWDRRPEPPPGSSGSNAAPAAGPAPTPTAAEADFAKFAEAPPSLPPAAGADLSGTALAGSIVRASAAGGGGGGELQGEGGAGGSPTDVVAASLAAASAAAAAAASAAASVYSAAAAGAASAASAAAPLANNVVGFTLSVTSTLPPVRSVAAQLQSAAAAGHSTAVATVAAVAAALDSAWGKDRRLPKECQSPTEWFVADDEATHTRYFVIQGSDNLDHWRVNLTFDPVVFEDEALGVKVHRGVYEAAQVLYERFSPLVQDHLASSPFARVAFTGHSLGGSLGTLLMLMFVRRGVLPRSCLAPTYTFGSPAIFCEGCGNAGRCTPGAGAQQCGGDARRGTAAAAGGLLPLLGLPVGAVRNVMMSKDIVPRAFACDYALVADLLKRVGGSFREHACLQGARQVMFNFVGQVMVLQPAADLTFVCGEGYHPMLPPAPGLFQLREPSSLQREVAAATREVAAVARAVQECADAITAGASDVCNVELVPSSSDAYAAAPAQPQQADTSTVIGSRAGPGFGPAPPSARDALFQLMNNPHPLDILSDSGAYGSTGAISRYHNPDHYTLALGAVLRSRGASWQRLMRHASAAGLRWHAPMLEPALPPPGAAAAGAAAAGAAAAQPQQTGAPLGVGARPVRTGGKLHLAPRRLASASTPQLS